VLILNMSVYPARAQYIIIGGYMLYIWTPSKSCMARAYALVKYGPRNVLMWNGRPFDVLMFECNESMSAIRQESFCSYREAPFMS